jgi:NifU-like protein involved in Fe-S cluster formation
MANSIQGGSSLQLQDLSFQDSGRSPLLAESDAQYENLPGLPLTEAQQLEKDMEILRNHPDRSTGFVRGLGSQQVAHRL